MYFPDGGWMGVAFIVFSFLFFALLFMFSIFEKFLMLTMPWLFVVFFFPLFIHFPFPFRDFLYGWDGVGFTSLLAAWARGEW